jgi:hypothetical protein
VDRVGDAGRQQPDDRRQDEDDAGERRVWKEPASRLRIRRIVVDLPDPFGPRNPVTRPGCTTKLRSLTAAFLP